MSDIALEFNHVWKKFKKGEIHDSLRDLIPAMAKSLFSRNHKDELKEKEFWALKDISFQVKRGEALGIIGPNGAGKSTALKLLSGILRPNKGEMKVKGRLSALIEVGAGFHQDLTGRENIYLNGAILGMKKDEVDSKFDEIVEFSGLPEFIDTPVKRYSSGMYARLGFSVAAHVNPEVLLVDEVLSVGDAGFQAKCLAKMHQIISDSSTLVFVSHNVRQVARLCKNIIVLSNGEVKYQGEPNRAIKTYYDIVSGISDNDESSDSFHGMPVSIKPIDSSGNKVHSVPFGSPLQLMAECNLPSGFPESYLLIKIGNHFAQDYIILNSEIGNMTIGPGHKKLLCHVDNCRFLPNTYRITAYLIDTQTGRVLDSFLNQPDLVVSMPDNEITIKLPSSQYAVLDVTTSWDIRD